MAAAADSWQAAPQVCQRNWSVVTDKIIISENQAKLHWRIMRSVYICFISSHICLYLSDQLNCFSSRSGAGRQTNQAFLFWCLPLDALDGRQIRLFCSGVCRWMIWAADKSSFFALVSAAGRFERQTNPAFSPCCLPLDDLNGRQIRLFCSGVCRWMLWAADKSGFFAMLSAAGCFGRQTNQAFSLCCLPLDDWTADKSGFFALLSAAGCCGRQAKRPAYRPCKLWTIRRSF